MTYDNAEDYLVRAQEAANSYDNEGRKEGIRQFIDDKSYKPGLGAYDKAVTAEIAPAGEDMPMPAWTTPDPVALHARTQPDRRLRRPRFRPALDLCRA